MFPFGSFLTHIPLIIIASAYMLYVGAYALNKTKNSDNSINYPEKEQYVSRASEKSHGNIYYYQKAFYGKQVGLLKAGGANILRELTIFLPHYIPDRKINTNFLGCNHFSRPPPYLG